MDPSFAADGRTGDDVKRTIVLDSLLGAAALGVSAGLRTFSAPALIADHLRRHPRSRARGAERLLQASAAAPVLGTLLLAEVVADKLPGMPDRIAPAGLIGRAASGALAGAALAGRRAGRAGRAGRAVRTALGAAGAPANGLVALAALVGAGAAVASAYAGFHLRRAAVRRLGLPDTAVALAEDGVMRLAGAVGVDRAR